MAFVQDSLAVERFGGVLLAHQWQVNVESGTIIDLSRDMAMGRVTSFELTRFFLERIASFNEQGPSLRAVAEVNPDALQLAEGLDRERALGKSRGLLHGIPILLKDNIDTGDKLHTCAGSIALADSHADSDAHLVSRLRAAGAVVLGKANMTEWANFMGYDMPNGYSARGGQVLNPYGPGVMDVGGSSSGSAAAVAANFCVAAVGTETSGSILHPSSFNSIVGIKPTVGLVSRRGVIPISHSQDTAGPMAKSVTDAAILLSVLAGYDAQDAATHASIGRVPTDYTVYLAQDGLAGVRIGVPDAGALPGLSEGEQRLFEEGLRVLEAQGAELVRGISLPTFNHQWVSRVMVHEFKVDLNAYLNRLGPRVPVHSLKELIQFNLGHADLALKYGQGLLEESEGTSGRLTEAEYIQELSQDQRMSRAEGIDLALHTHQIEAIVFPSFYGAEIAAKAGYPSVTVPAGYLKDGTPMGLTFTATAYAEPQLIRLAFAYEQATQHRVPPNGLV